MSPFCPRTVRAATRADELIGAATYTRLAPGAAVWAGPTMRVGGLQVLMLEAEAHLNTSFKHFTFFITEFAMIQDRELAPMLDLIHRNLVGALFRTYCLHYARLCAACRCAGTAKCAGNGDCISLNGQTDRHPKDETIVTLCIQLRSAPQVACLQHGIQRTYLQPRALWPLLFFSQCRLNWASTNEFCCHGKPAEISRHRSPRDAPRFCELCELVFKPANIMTAWDRPPTLGHSPRRRVWYPRMYLQRVVGWWTCEPYPCLDWTGLDWTATHCLADCSLSSSMDHQGGMLWECAGCSG